MVYPRWPVEPRVQWRVCYAETRDMRRLQSVPLAFFVALFLVVVAGDSIQLSPTEMAAAPYRYNLVGWEISHVPDKWVHKLGSIFPWNSQSREKRLEDLREYFRLGEELRGLERELAALHTGATPDSDGPPADATEKRLKALRDRRSAMKAWVEETLESEVSAVLSREGLEWWLGLLLPPVDVSLSQPPRVLVVSPRDRIERTETILLEPGMDVPDMEALEARIFREQDLAALVVGIGGVATYPTTVQDRGSLRHALATSAHEWLHVYWFFRPLGWNIFSSPDMNTLNETAADLAGEELGDRVYEAITGEKIEEPPPPPPPEEDPDRFDFDQEMGETRVRVDELLGQGLVEEAEAYMEQRRRLFVDNGFHIRKLNQAYFAFNGTYASNPASVSPIGDQVDEVREASDSVGEFIRTMSGFGSLREFLDHVSGLPEGDTTTAGPLASPRPAS